MGKRRKKTKEVKKPKQINWHRRHIGKPLHYHYETVIVLDEELKQLKRDIDLIDLDSKVSDEAQMNDRWSANVLTFNGEGFIDPDNLVPLNSIFQGPADIHLLNWDAFIQKFWETCVALAQESTRVEYLIAYVNKKSNEAWQLANDTDEPLPANFTVEAGPADILYDQFLGTMRIPHVWQDQLLWACEFLKIEMP